MTTHLLLLPNRQTETLDYFHIPSSFPPLGSEPLPLKPVLSISLPTLGRGCSIDGIGCRAEPNPVSETSPLLTRNTSTSNFAFTSSPQDAIALFHLRVQCENGIKRFQLVVHRYALIELFTNKDALALVDPDKSSEIPVLPYSSWGPPITRWFHTTNMVYRWMSTNAGQRYVQLSVGASDGGKGCIRVFDFNKWNVRRQGKFAIRDDGGAVDQCIAQDSFRSLPVDERGEEEHSEAVKVWNAESLGTLPFCVTESEFSEKYAFDAVLLDEGNLLGLHVSRPSDFCLSSINFSGSLCS